MLEPDLVYFVVATLASYFLLHFYRPPAVPAASESAGNVKRISNGTGCTPNRRRLKRDDTSFHKGDNNNLFESIQDSFLSYDALWHEIQRVGIQKARLVIGIDFTASNEWQGRKTFNKQCLHKLSCIRTCHIYNPYQKIIHALGKVLDSFVEPNTIYAYGFGDSSSQDTSVFNIAGDFETDKPCFDFKAVLQAYNRVVPRVTLSGPTSFAPLIRQTIDHAKETINNLYILVILADGQMEEEGPTLEALVDASNYPISVIMVGVGDGPWGLMEDCDDLLPARRFDNFQFVNFHETFVKEGRTEAEANFALAALMELPAQYVAMRELGYFSKNKKQRQKRQSLER